MASSLDLALDYITWNPTHKIFPVAAGKKLPPCFEGYQAAASNDPEQIKKWHKRYPGCSWGVEPANSGIIALDADLKEGKNGQVTLDMLELEYGPLPPTSTVITPSGGKHFRFKATETVKHKFRINGFGEHCDSPHYTVIPGCVMRDGKTYEYENDTELADAPDWFLKLPAWSKPTKVEITEQDFVSEPDTDDKIKMATSYLIDDAPIAKEGENGDATTLRVCGTLKDMGISEPRAIELVRDHYNERCEPPWEDGGETKVHNAYAYLHENAPGSHTTAQEDFDDDPLPPLTPKEKKKSDKAAKDNKAKATPLTKNTLPPMEGPRTYEPSKTKLRGQWVWCATQMQFVRRYDGLLWDKEQFNSMFNNLYSGKSASKELVDKPAGMLHLEGLKFVPGQPETVDVGDMYNIWRESDVVPKQGDTTIWNEHITYLFPDAEQRNHLLNWLAWVYRHQKLKPNHALLLVGETHGTGKSWVARVMSHLIGLKNTKRPKNSSLKGDFNGWALQCKFAIIEELMQIGKREVANELRDVITEPTIEVNMKNVKAFEIDNYLAMMAISNHPDALPLEESDRRWLVLKTHAQTRSDHDSYYSRLFKVLDDSAALAAIAAELRDRDIGKYDARENAPMTLAKGDMITSGLSDLEHWMTDHSGEYPLSGRIIAVDDVFSVLPNHLSRSRRSAVVSALRHRFKGVSLGQHRLANSDRASLWAINGTGATNIEGVDYAKVYEKDRADAGSGKRTKEAEEEFSS